MTSDPGEASKPQAPKARAKPSIEVSGNALRVYLYLLRNGPSELRDIQRSLGLSTPSLASYHLNRLASGGYVFQDEHGRYCATVEAAGDILDGFSRLGAFLVPQLFFFAALFTPVLLYFSYMAVRSPSYVPLLVASSLCLVGVLWFETARVWRRLGNSQVA